MKVLVACEYSGRVRDAFIARGHDAISCDLLPTDVAGPHYQGDVFDIINDGWDLMVAHPPCTYLTNSGSGWLYNKDGSKNEERWENLKDGAEFFKKLCEAPIEKKAIENPIQHKHAVELHGQGKATQYVQPWMFGHMEQKATGLWLYGLPKLKPTNDVKLEMMKLPKNARERLHYLPPSEDRWKLRSMTYPGIADAMAEQWG
jgi:hypothetical protein